MTLNSKIWHSTAAFVTLCALGGCAAQKVEEKPFFVPVVHVESNSYCKIAGNLTYSRADSPDTIALIRKERAKRAKLCGRSTS